MFRLQFGVGRIHRIDRVAEVDGGGAVVID